MIDLKNPDICPCLEESSLCLSNSLFDKFCQEIKSRFQAREKIAFSKCNWEYGWDIKFKKFGKSLYTINQENTSFPR